MLYKNRKQAGVILASKLRKYRDDDGVVLAVPRGGVPVAYYVARELEFPLELVLTKKIGHPLNKEYAIGAASLDDYFVVDHPDVNESYINEKVVAVQDHLGQMYRKFMGHHEPVSLEKKTVIVVDDGIATGNTMLATINLLKKKRPAKIIIAVPVASQNAIELLEKEVNEIICPLRPTIFFGVGSFYEDFSEVSDNEVLEYLDRWNRLKKAG